MNKAVFEHFILRRWCGLSLEEIKALPPEKRRRLLVYYGAVAPDPWLDVWKPMLYLTIPPAVIIALLLLCFGAV